MNGLKQKFNFCVFKIEYEIEIYMWININIHTFLLIKSEL